MFRGKRKRRLMLTPSEARLALRALLSFRNKVVAKGIDAVDVEGIIKRFTQKDLHHFLIMNWIPMPRKNEYITHS